MKNRGMLLLVMAALSVSAIGCGKSSSDSSGSSSAGPTKTPDPVSLTFYNFGNIADDTFAYFSEQLKKKYPYITLDQIKRGSQGANPPDLVAAGTFPDFIVTNDDTLVSTFKPLDLLMDISDLVKKENIDVSRFEQASMDRSKVDGQQVGLPYNMSYGALFYNKDIFNKFGVAYPKDGMNWDDTLQLAKTMTRVDQGIQYRGLDPQSMYVVKVPTITFLDPKTDKANLSSNDWKDTINLYKNIVTIPGNEQKGTAYADMTNGFIKNRTTAMVVSNVMGALPDATKNGFDWDMVQMPFYKTHPEGVGPAQTTVLAVSKSTKNKDAVMKVISYLTSDEAQTYMTRTTALYPAVKKQEIKDGIGADLDFLKGKNIKAALKGKPFGPIQSSKYDVTARPLFDKMFPDFINGKLDANSLISQAEEQMNKAVSAAKQ